MTPRRALAILRRYQYYEALRPFTCADSPEHYLLEPCTVMGDVLLICPTCGYAELVDPAALAELDRRARIAGSFWRGIPA